MLDVSLDDPRFTVALKLFELYPPVEQGGKRRPGTLSRLLGSSVERLHEAPSGVSLIVPRDFIGKMGEWLTLEEMCSLLGMLDIRGRDPIRVPQRARFVGQYVVPGVVESYLVLPELERFYVIVDRERLLAMNTVHRVTGIIPKPGKQEEPHAHR